MSLLRIGEVARRAGMTPDAIRYYERLGVIPRAGRTPAGYRQYGAGIVQRLLIVRNAQRFGFSLEEIGRFLRVRDGGGAPCRDVRAAAQRMLDQVDRQIDALLAAREDMKRTLEEWDERLAAARGGPARLLEHLPPLRTDAAIGRGHGVANTRSASRARSRQDEPSIPQSKRS